MSQVKTGSYMHAHPDRRGVQEETVVNEGRHKTMVFYACKTKRFYDLVQLHAFACLDGVCGCTRFEIVLHFVHFSQEVEITQAEARRNKKGYRLLAVEDSKRP